jgi:hypothetical protein
LKHGSMVCFHNGTPYAVYPISEFWRNNPRKGFCDVALKKF